MALNNLTDKLSDLVEATETAGTETGEAEKHTDAMGDAQTKKGTRPAKPGDNFKWDKATESWVAMTAEEIAKKNETIAKKTANTAIYNNLIQRSQSNKISEVKKALKKAMSARARIAAYVTNTDSKFEITSKKNSSKTAYDLTVVNKAPSAIKAVVITLPATLDTLKNQVEAGEDTPEILEQLQIIAATKEETPAIAVIVKPWEEFAKFLQNDCAGFLHEDDSIFVTYTAKNKKIYRNPADIEQKDGMPASGSYVYLKYTTNANAARTYSIKHSIRAKILAPGNYISIKRWKTEAMLTSYSDEDAAVRIRAHLKRFVNTKKDKEGNVTPAIINQLSPEANMLVKLSGGNIQGTAFFPSSQFTGTAWISSAAAKGVAHWYNKDSEGRAAVVLPSQIALVSKVEQTTASGKSKIVAEYDVLKLAAASDATYKFDKVNFPQIIAALRNHDTEAFELINKELKKARATASKAKAKTGSKYKSFANSGEDVANLTLEDIQSILSKV